MRQGERMMMANTEREKPIIRDGEMEMERDQLLL